MLNDLNFFVLLKKDIVFNCKLFEILWNVKWKLRENKKELENPWFQLFQKHQRTDSFMKEPTNNLQLERQFFEI